MIYDDLRDRIGDALGYGLAKANWSGNPTKVDRVERILVGGLNRFFNNPVLPGERERHMWSFLTPVVEIELTTGVTEYELPGNFAMFNGPMTYAPGVTVLYPPIIEVGEQKVRFELQTTNATGRPCIFGVRVNAGDIDAGTTSWELVVAPIPDQDYTVLAPITINPVVPQGDSAIPLGGQPHEQTLVEACLAEWETFDEYAGFVHQQRFMECLISSVSYDRNVTCPKTAGYMGDPGAYRKYGFRRDWHEWDEGRTFYNGIET